MRLYLVGGFLGSGKTTAIVAAARILMERGLSVGVVTNDQGKHLVDSVFFEAADIPTVEVSGGCFCCNYDDLEDRLSELDRQSAPDVVFAESVGSCADMVATVVKPLLALNEGVHAPSSFSVFADSRLLRQWLLGRSMPFSEDVVYIFEKQLEEAGLIVVNKVDLLSSLEVSETVELTRARFPEAEVRAQNSLDEHGARGWLEDLDAGWGAPLQTSLSMDYDRYAKGEGDLLWIDDRLRLTPPHGVERRDMAITAIRTLVEAIEASGILIGHLKFLVSCAGRQVKISFTRPSDPGWETAIPTIDSGDIEILVNARVQTERTDVRELLHEAVANHLEETTIRWSDGAEFHPSRPVPTFRME